jgi:hypothetical protein
MRVLLVLILIGIAYSSLAWGTLPPPSPASKAQATETAAKSAWSAKMAQYESCRAEDHVVDVYRREIKAAGKEAPAPQPTAPCQDPGPYKSPSAGATRPLEAAGAHSPAQTASSPPSSQAHAADVQPAPRP